MEKKNKGGRPKTGRYDNVAQELNDYVDNAKIPILAEFAYKNNYTKDWLYRLAKEDDALNTAIKKCSQKKEAILEMGALSGKLNSTMAIFSLKQLGWKDHVETEAKVEIESDGFIEALQGRTKQTFEGADDIVEA